jgi:16S rRNA (adenine1518-N6/adenine1519-N6)-dimethyltransferase
MNHIPRKRFGQHFLHDQQVIFHIVQTIAPTPNDTIVEIGPGLGALTTQLLPLVKKMDVVELDRDVIPELITKCESLGELVVHQADALKFNFAELAPKNKKLRIVGNLPYNISTPLLFHLLEQANVIQDMFFMLQKEVVDRICAKANEDDYGRLSVMMQYYCEAHALFTVKPGAFNPPPKVESAIVQLVPHTTRPYVANDVVLFATIVREAFNHRRKTLRNCLKNFISAEKLTELGIDPIRRPEELSVEEYVRIANHINPL